MIKVWFLDQYSKPLDIDISASAAVAGIHNVYLGLETTTLIISTKEIKDMKIVIKIIENEAGSQRWISWYIIGQIMC